MDMKRFLVSICLFLALGAAAGAVFAQRGRDQEPASRSVQGAVTNDSGSLVEGAVVHLKNTKNLQVRSYITKEDGTYAFHGLSTNIDYELKAEYQGASSDAKTLSVFDSRNKAIINLRLNKK